MVCSFAFGELTSPHESSRRNFLWHFHVLGGDD